MGDVQQHPSALAGPAIIIGVMGGGSATTHDAAMAHNLGRLIATKGWVLLNGGRSAGIMEASARGAFEQGGLTIGILPDSDTRHTSRYIRIPILTGMGHARNSINVLSSHVVVACPGGAGTISEIALALKSGRPVVLLGFEIGSLFDEYAQKGMLFRADTPEAAVSAIERLL